MGCIAKEILMIIIWQSIIFFISSTYDSSTTIIEFDIHEDSSAEKLASSGCRSRYQSCYRLAKPAIEYEQHLQFNKPLENWKFNPYCRCLFPPQSKVNYLQYLHIPKTGTSINWLLHSYFENCTVDMSNPCSRHLTNITKLSDALCNGRLISCAGHLVSPDLPLSVRRDETNMLTMLRNPWNRLQSDYYYIKRKPQSEHLGNGINTTHLLSTVHSVYEYAKYPGISNCATKMLNGIQCTDTAELNDNHLNTAKEVLTAMLWFGITEYYNSSICQFSWMYGAYPDHFHFSKSRSGSYEYKSMENELSKTELTEFFLREKFDIALYEFAVGTFLKRMESTGCPLLEVIN